MNRLAFRLAGMGAIVFATAQSGCAKSGSTAPLPRREAVTTADIRRILSVLADDSLEGRMTGTRGADKAAAIIVAEMKAIGLTPGGDSGYFQHVPLKVLPGPAGRRAVRLVDSWAALDTVPADRRRSSSNVIGLIRGSDPALRDQVVLIDAHYDHLGIGPPVAGDSIYNGADDDASGIVAVLEIARALAAGPPPKRTIIFMATTGEEEGLLGTTWYIAHPSIPFSQMVANMEIEMIGRPDPLVGGAGKAWLTGYERSTMGDMLRQANLPVVPDPRPEQQFFVRSDNIAFARMGIPAHTLSSFGMHSDYHQPSDEVSAADFDHMTTIVRAAAAAARILADGPAPQWKPGGRPPSEPVRYR